MKFEMLTPEPKVRAILTMKKFEEMLINGNIRDNWHRKQHDLYVTQYYKDHPNATFSLLSSRR